MAAAPGEGDADSSCGRLKVPPLLASTGVKDSLELYSLHSYNDKAVCNDGTAAGFYFKRGDPSLWAIYLQGGGWCYDEASCLNRGCGLSGFFASKAPQSHFMCRNLATNASWPLTREFDGVFSNDPSLSPLANATKVYIPYCTSDAHTGNTLHPVSWGQVFRGDVVIKSTVELLIEDSSFGLSDAPVSETSARANPPLLPCPRALRII
jgi:hypothetical protein